LFYAEGDYAAEFREAPAEHLRQEIKCAWREEPTAKRFDCLIEVGQGKEERHWFGRGLDHPDKALDEQRFQSVGHEIYFCICHWDKPPVFFPGGIVHFFDEVDVAVEALFCDGAGGEVGVTTACFFSEPCEPVEWSFREWDDIGHEVFCFGETGVCYEVGVVLWIVGHHESRRGIESIDQQAALVVGCEVHWAEDSFHALVAGPIDGGVEQGAADFRVIYGFEEPEERCLIGVETDVVVIDQGRYSAHVGAVARGDPHLDFRVLEKRVLGFKYLLEVIEQRRDPVRVILVNTVRYGQKTEDIPSLLFEWQNIKTTTHAPGSVLLIFDSVKYGD